MRLADRYELGERISEGGMGVVLRARDTRLGRDVAVKILPRERVGDATARERLVREAKTAASIEHPAIVHVYDVGETDDGGAFLVMELVKGASLRDAIAGGIAPAALVRHVVAVARALGAAHRAGLVHRDVKPENVMIRDDGRAVLLDFGLAKAAVSAAQLTGEGVILGTPAYLAPEQAEGRELDARVDQFALGVTAYEGLTGRLPWQGTSSAQMVAAILRDEPPPPSAMNRHLPRELDAPLARAMAKRPAERFESIDAFADALEAVASKLAGVSAAALAPTEEMASYEPVTRARGRGLAVVAGAVAIAATALAARFVVTREPPPAAPAIDAATPAAASVYVLTDAPTPESQSVEARAAYRAGLQASRDGAAAQAFDAFQRAVTLDPTCAAAYVRLADMALGESDLGTARPALAKAMALRGTLPPRERDLLDVDEPLVLRTPPDMNEALRRVNAHIAAAPGDAEWRLMRAYVEMLGSDWRAAGADAHRARELDPQFGLAFLVEGFALDALGHDDEALATFDACVRAVGPQGTCLAQHAALLADRGDCDGLAADAESMIAAAPDVSVGYHYRRWALVAKGAPRETLAAATAQRTATITASIRAVKDVLSRESDAMAFGDFDAVVRTAHEGERVLAEEKNLAPHAIHALALAEALVESGRGAEAARVATGYLRSRDLWIANGLDEGPMTDTTPRLVAIARDGGALSEAEASAARDAFVKRWTALDRAVDAGLRIWIAAYASAASTPAAAREALALMPDGGAGDVMRDMRASVGEVERLAGRLPEARALLERAVRACASGEVVVRQVRAALSLGETCEALDDAACACRAYASVLDRWGAAKPRSITAEKARARRRALDCK
jgi:serine/threonine-protein kinase